MPSSSAPSSSNRVRAGLDAGKKSSAARARGSKPDPKDPRRSRHLPSSDTHTQRLERGSNPPPSQWKPLDASTPEDLPAAPRVTSVLDSGPICNALIRRDGRGDSSSSSSPEPLLNILGVADGDPFDVCPLPSERRARELLSLYVGTDSYTTAAVQFSASGRRFETDLRRERWFPLALKSKAGYAGLIAYLETGRDNPLPEQTELYRRHYLNAGLTDLAEALKDPQKCLQNETIFAILMFLTIAMHQRDFAAVGFHAEGLFRMVCERAKAAGEDPPLAQVRPRPGYEDTGVPRLVENGLISPRFAEILRCNLILSQYAAAYSRDYVAGFGTGHHIWKKADFPKEMSSLEQGIMTGFRIYIRRVATKNPLTVTAEYLTTTLHRHIQSCNLEPVWEVAPFLMLWFALIAGPASEEETFDFFVSILKESQARTFTWSFQAAVQMASQLFFWSPGLNTMTEQYWDRVISTSQMPGPYRTPMTPPPSDSGADLLERPPTMQVAVAMRGPRASSQESGG